jgi:hypothetical protein
MKNILLLIGLLVGLRCLGQTPGQQRFSSSAWAGAVFQSLNAALLVDPQNGHYITAERLGPGASLGIAAQWQLLPGLQFRPALGLGYSANTIRFWSADGEEERRQYSFADILVPVHFVLSNSLQHLPVRALILFGGQASWNLVRTPATAPLHLLPERLGLDIGLGAGFVCGKWSVQPEVLYSFGVNNVHEFTNGAYDWAAGRLVRDQLCLRVLLTRRH